MPSSRTILIAMIAIGALAATAHAQQPITRTSLNGEWTGTLVLDNSKPTITVVFALTDTSFGGRVYSDGSVVGDMENGTLVGSRVHFTVGRFDFTGIVTGSRMNVDLIVYNGTTRAFTLSKMPEAKRDTTLVPQARQASRVIGGGRQPLKPSFDGQYNRSAS